MSTTVAAAAATVEELFLRGEYAEALSESQAKLAQRTLELRQELRDAGADERSAPCMTSDEERVFSIYLQAVFELDADNEVDTAIAVVDAFAPLPFDVAVQWVKFLLAMRRRDAAKSYLKLHIARVQRILVSEPSVGETAAQYVQLVETLAEQLVLEEDGSAAALQLIREDPVLDDITKLKLVGRVEERVAVLHAESKSAASAAPRSNISGIEAPSSSSSQHTIRTTTSGTATDDDNSYALVGGAAIAVAVAAVGAIRYRDRIHESLSQVLPAISKGLADAKYALFD